MNYRQLQRILDRQIPDRRSLIEVIKVRLHKKYREVYEEWAQDSFRVDHIFKVVFDKTDAKDLSTTLLHMVCYHGCLDRVERLISESELSSEFKDICGNTPLHMAALGNHLRVVEYLVNEKNVDPSVGNDCGKTPLHIGASHGFLKVVKFLASKVGVAPDVRDNRGCTPLHLAAFSGHLKVVKYLVDKVKVAPDVRHNANNTPLHLAAFSGHLEVVRYLVDERGAASNLKNDAGITPRVLAERRGHTEIVEYFDSLGNVTPDKKSNNGVSFPHVAGKNVLSETTECCVDEDKEIVKATIEKGCCSSLKNDDSKTPMVPSKCKEVGEILEKTEDKQRDTANTVVEKDLTSDRGAVLLPQGKPASKKQLVKLIGIGSVIAMLAVAAGCIFGNVQFGLAIGIVLASIAYLVLKPGNKLNEVNVSVPSNDNTRVRSMCN